MIERDDGKSAVTTLADVIESLQADPPAERKLRLAWDERRVAALPRATRPLRMPVVAGPGACWVAVPEGLPVPPGAEDMDRLTGELLALYEKQQRWEGRDYAMARVRDRMKQIDELEAELVRQRERAEAELAELEEVGPVELDWAAAAARIIKLSGYEPIPWNWGEGRWSQLGDGTAFDGGDHMRTRDVYTAELTGPMHSLPAGAAVARADRIVAEQRTAKRRVDARKRIR